MLGIIMIATDGSEASRHAADLGIGLARQSSGKVIATYVVDMQRLIQIHGYTTMPGIKESLLNAMTEEGEEALAYVKRRSKDAGVPCDKAMLRGDPSEELIRYSREIGADLLVLGKIGRTGIAKFLLGSVAEEVVRHSGIPVMLAPFRKHNSLL
jgi:nucleotide-binding universal stress UspA family protein